MGSIIGRVEFLYITALSDRQAATLHTQDVIVRKSCIADSASRTEFGLLLSQNCGKCHAERGEASLTMT
jgi:hypothetical protein